MEPSKKVMKLSKMTNKISSIAFEKLITKSFGYFLTKKLLQQSLTLGHRPKGVAWHIKKNRGYVNLQLRCE